MGADLSRPATHPRDRTAVSSTAAQYVRQQLSGNHSLLDALLSSGSLMPGSLSGSNSSGTESVDPSQLELPPLPFLLPPCLRPNLTAPLSPFVILLTLKWSLRSFPVGLPPPHLHLQCTPMAALAAKEEEECCRALGDQAVALLRGEAVRVLSPHGVRGLLNWRWQNPSLRFCASKSMHQCFSAPPQTSSSLVAEDSVDSIPRAPPSQQRTCSLQRRRLDSSSMNTRLVWWRRFTSIMPSALLLLWIPRCVRTSSPPPFHRPFRPRSPLDFACVFSASILLDISFR